MRSRMRMIGIIALCFCARANTRFTIDQRNDPPEIPRTFQSVQMLGPLGQEFTPSAEALNRVDLFLADFDVDGAGAHVSVIIRRNNLDGPIQGRSETLALPDGFEGLAQFAFAEALHLTPGVRYVLEINVERGDNWSVCVGDDTYARGRQIFRGLPRADSDLWFRVGLATLTAQQ